MLVFHPLPDATRRTLTAAGLDPDGVAAQ